MLLVGCDNGIAMELSEFFSFFVPGYKYMPLFRNKVWDGKVRLFNPASYELPVGLLSYVKEFAEKRGYTVEYEDGPFGPPESFNKIDAKEVEQGLKSVINRKRNGTHNENHPKKVSQVPLYKNRKHFWKKSMLSLLVDKDLRTIMHWKERLETRIDSSFLVLLHL